MFRVTAGLPAPGKAYGGWEGSELRGHTMGHYLSACALMYAEHGRRAAQGPSGHARGRAGQVPEGPRRPRLSQRLSRVVHRPRRGPPAGLGAVLHAAQDHGRPARFARPLRQPPGPGSARRHGPLVQGPLRQALRGADAADAQRHRAGRHERRAGRVSTRSPAIRTTWPCPGGSWSGPTTTRWRPAATSSRASTSTRSSPT